MKQGKKLAKINKSDNSYKDRIYIKKKAKEINEVELRMWYENSVYKKVSSLDYSENLARERYEVFLENELKYVAKINDKYKKGQKDINDISPKDKKRKECYPETNDEDESEKKPLFTIKFKK